jgi:hypothetical protein
MIHRILFFVGLIALLVGLTKGGIASHNSLEQQSTAVPLNNPSEPMTSNTTP